MLCEKPAGCGVCDSVCFDTHSSVWFSLPPRQPQMIQAKLLKADLHGAVISGNVWQLVVVWRLLTRCK